MERENGELLGGISKSNWLILLLLSLLLLLQPANAYQFHHRSLSGSKQEKNVAGGGMLKTRAGEVERGAGASIFAVSLARAGGLGGGRGSSSGGRMGSAGFVGAGTTGSHHRANAGAVNRRGTAASALAVFASILLHHLV